MKLIYKMLVAVAMASEKASKKLQLLWKEKGLHLQTSWQYVIHFNVLKKPNVLHFIIPYVFFQERLCNLITAVNKWTLHLRFATLNTFNFIFPLLVSHLSVCSSHARSMTCWSPGVNNRSDCMYAVTWRPRRVIMWPLRCIAAALWNGWRCCLVLGPPSAAQQSSRWRRSTETQTSPWPQERKSSGWEERATGRCSLYFPCDGEQRLWMPRCWLRCQCISVNYDRNKTLCAWQRGLNKYVCCTGVDIALMIIIAIFLY